MYAYIVFLRNAPGLVFPPVIWARSIAHARQILKRQEGFTAGAFDVRHAPELQ